MKKGIDYIGITTTHWCHDGAGNVLLNLRSTNCRDEHGRWDLCGGSVDFGETVEETSAKELMEEYEVEALEREFLGYRSYFRDQEVDAVMKKNHWISFDFKVRIDPAQAKNAEPHKFETIQWFPKDALPTPLHSQFPKFLETYKDRL